MICARATTVQITNHGVHLNPLGAIYAQSSEVKIGDDTCFRNNFAVADGGKVYTIAASVGTTVAGWPYHANSGGARLRGSAVALASLGC